MIELKNVSKWYGTFQVLKIACNYSESDRHGYLRTLWFGQIYIDQVREWIEKFQEGEIFVNSING